MIDSIPIRPAGWRMADQQQVPWPDAEHNAIDVTGPLSEVSVFTVILINFPCRSFTV